MDSLVETIERAVGYNVGMQGDSLGILSRHLDIETDCSDCRKDILDSPTHSLHSAVFRIVKIGGKKPS